MAILYCLYMSSCSDSHPVLHKQKLLIWTNTRGNGNTKRHATLLKYNSPGAIISFLDIYHLALERNKVSEHSSFTALKPQKLTKLPVRLFAYSWLTPLVTIFPYKSFLRSGGWSFTTHKTALSHDFHQDCLRAHL